MVAYGRTRQSGKIDPSALPTPYLNMILADSPVAVWPLAGGSGAELIAARDFTLTGSPSAQTGGPDNTSTGFDGSTQYGQTASASQLAPSGDITFEAWAYLAATTDTTVLGAVAASGNTFAWLFYISLGKWWAAIGQSNGSPHLDASSPSSVVAETWYHLAATLSGTTLTLYVNGSVVASNSSTTGSRYTGSIPVHVGRYNSTWPTPKFNGRLAYAAFYGSALSAGRIAARAAFA